MCKNLFLDPKKLHDDLRLLGVALRQRWDIPDDFRAVIMQRLRTVIETSLDDELAIKAIVQVRNMEAQNQKDEHKQIDEFSQRVISIANQLGIDVSALGIGQATDAGASAGSRGLTAPKAD